MFQDQPASSTNETQQQQQQQQQQKQQQQQHTPPRPVKPVHTPVKLQDLFFVGRNRTNSIDSINSGTSNNSTSRNVTPILAKKALLNVTADVRQGLFKLQTNFKQAHNTDSTAEATKRMVANRTGQAKRGIQHLGQHLSKLNLSTLIDRMEKDQVVADQLEEINEHWQQDKEFRDLKRQAEEACMKEVETHLAEFLDKHKTQSELTTNGDDDAGNHISNSEHPASSLDQAHPTYEQWIEDLHPENAHAGKLLEGLEKEIDLRFYVEESDHLRLWNRSVPEKRRVIPRDRMYREKHKVESVDFLADDSTVDPFAQNVSNVASVPAESSTTTESKGGGDLISFD